MMCIASPLGGVVNCCVCVNHAYSSARSVGVLGPHDYCMNVYGNYDLGQWECWVGLSKWGVPMYIYRGQL